MDNKEISGGGFFSKTESLYKTDDLSDDVKKLLNNNLTQKIFDNIKKGQASGNYDNYNNTKTAGFLFGNNGKISQDIIDNNDLNDILKTYILASSYTELLLSNTPIYNDTSGNTSGSTLQQPSLSDLQTGEGDSTIVGSEAPERAMTLVDGGGGWVGTEAWKKARVASIAAWAKVEAAATKVREMKQKAAAANEEVKYAEHAVWRQKAEAEKAARAAQMAAENVEASKDNPGRLKFELHWKEEADRSAANHAQWVAESEAREASVREAAREAQEAAVAAETEYQKARTEAVAVEEAAAEEERTLARAVAASVAAKKTDAPAGDDGSDYQPLEPLPLPDTPEKIKYTPEAYEYLTQDNWKKWNYFPYSLKKYIFNKIILEKPLPPESGEEEGEEEGEETDEELQDQPSSSDELDNSIIELYKKIFLVKNIDEINNLNAESNSDNPTFSDVKNYINKKIKSLVDTSYSRTEPSNLPTTMSELHETMQPLIQTLEGSQRELETPEAQEALGSSAEGMSERLSRSIESLEMEPASREDPREMELKRAQERVAQSEAAVERAKAESARFAPQETSERPPPSGSQDTDSESESKYFTLNTNITTLISEMIDHLGPSQKSILQFEQILNFIVLYIRLNLLLIINNISSEKEKHEAILDRAKKEAAKEAAERQAAARKAAKEVEAQRRREEAAARKKAKEEEAQRRREEAAKAKAKAKRDKKAVSRKAMVFDDDSDDEELQQEAAARTMQQYMRKQQERKEKAKQAEAAAAEAERQSKLITTWKRGDSGPSTQPVAATSSAEPPE